MKTRILFLIITLISLQVSISAQSCLPEGIVFTTQSQIDSFQINYPGCNKIEGDVFIGSYWGDTISANITNLYGLNALTSIGGDLRICRNAVLPSLTGLDNIDTVGGNVEIGPIAGMFDPGNDSLVDLTGLGNLTSVGKGFIINYNKRLINLSGLESLESIGEQFTIGYITSFGGGNPSLESLTGIENLENIGFLYVEWNEMLSDCAIQSICNYLSNSNASVYFFNNASGCNSPEEVMDSCGIVSIGETSVMDLLDIYPNPSSGSLNLRYSISETRDTKLELYSIQGIKVRTLLGNVQPPGEYEISFDISDMPAGMYFVRMQIGKKVETVKIIKLGDRR